MNNSKTVVELGHIRAGPEGTGQLKYQLIFYKVPDGKHRLPKVLMVNIDYHVLVSFLWTGHRDCFGGEHGTHY